MENCESTSIFYFVLILCRLAICHVEGNSFSGNETGRFKSERKVMGRDGFTPRISTYDVRKLSFQVSGNILNKTNDSKDRNVQQSFIRRFDHETFHDFMPSKSSMKPEGYWIMKPSVNYTKRNENVRKLDHGITWPAWSSKKEIYNHNNKNRKHRKYSDNIDDYLGLDSKLHDFMSDRKYIHEHEGFIFPIHVPSHNEKDDNLIPLLLLLLLPLLLFAIIIPLNANLLSTLFLIMQNNGATTTAAQLAAATGRRKKRHLIQPTHPLIEDRIWEMLNVIDKISETSEIFKTLTEA